MRKLIAVPLFVIVAGCATPEQRAERTIARHAPFCEKLGYVRDTDPWRQCILSRAQSEDLTPPGVVPPRPKTCYTFGNVTQCN